MLLYTDRNPNFVEQMSSEISDIYIETMIT